MARPMIGIFQNARDQVTKWQLLGAAAVMAILSVGFLCVAVDLWLTERLGPMAAAAATAGLLALTTLALIGISAIVMPSGRRNPVPERNANIAELAAMIITLSEKLDIETRASIKPLTIVALAAGCAVGYSPALRRTLKDLLS